jgi:hypothetical protein
MKSLLIPNRDRLKGQTILCRKCGNKYCSQKGTDGKTKWMCKSIGKRIGSCPNPDSQRFTSTLYNPFTQKPDILIRHETRDFWEFRKRHNELLDIEREIKHLYKEGRLQQAMELVKSFRKKPKVKSIDESNPVVKEVIISSQTYLESAMYIYSDFIDGKIGEKWEKRPKSEKSIVNYKRALERFHTCLRKCGYNPEIITLESLSKKHLNCWVREVKDRYNSNKTQNDYLNSISTFLKWCSKRGAGEVCNSLDFVQRGKTKGDTSTASLLEFTQMMDLVTPENGKGYEKWTDGKTGKTVSKSKNFYRQWLYEGLWLSLLLGGRGDDITDFKWNEIHTRTENGNSLYWIELFDHKYYAAQGVEKNNFIPVYKQTYDILLSLGLKEKIGTEEYVIAPEFQNRKRMKRILGESFRWYWREVAGYNPQVKYKSLRSTFITLATNLAGEQYQLIQKHTKSDITRKHYFDKSVAVSNMYGQDFFGGKVGK